MVQLAGCWAHGAWHRRISPSSPIQLQPPSNSQAHSAHRDTAGCQRQITHPRTCTNSHILLPKVTAWVRGLVFTGPMKILHSYNALSWNPTYQTSCPQPTQVYVSSVSSDSGLEHPQSFFQLTKIKISTFILLLDLSGRFLNGKLTFAFRMSSISKKNVLSCQAGPRWAACLVAHSEGKKQSLSGSLWRLTVSIQCKGQCSSLFDDFCPLLLFLKKWTCSWERVSHLPLTAHFHRDQEYKLRLALNPTSAFTSGLPVSHASGNR